MTVRDYRYISLILASIFFIVGLVFLLIPNLVIESFNIFSIRLGMKLIPRMENNIYLILAVAYMYLLSLLAFLMYKKPYIEIYPYMLTQAKFCSSILSLLFFILKNQYLIYLVNYIIDFFWALLVLYLYQKSKERFIRKNF